MTTSTSSLQHLENKFWRDDLPDIDFCEEVFKAPVGDKEKEESNEKEREENSTRRFRSYFDSPAPDDEDESPPVQHPVQEPEPTQ